MRRQLILVLFILLVTVALASAQEDEPTHGSGGEQLLASPSNMVQGAWHPVELTPMAPSDAPLSITATPATDLCTLAPPLKINDGGVTNVRFFSEQGDDPELACMWGNPSRIQGYRTAWYEFTPSFNGVVALSTQGSTYDTVLAVYTGACGALTQIACNDDDNYFTSRHTFEVKAGETYYVEVADWQSGASGSVSLSLQSLLEPTVSQWVVTSEGSDTASFRSRHAVVSRGDRLYVIGGQTVLGSNSVRTPSVYAYNTSNGNVEPLPSMTKCTGDGLGYSNTTAALVGARIYMPSGYIGNESSYEGTHCVYDINSQEWYDDVAAPNNWVGGQPAIYTQAVPHSFTGYPGTGYFVVGGLTGPFPTSNSSAGWVPRQELYFYSVDYNSWIDLNDMSDGRFGHVAGKQTINGQTYICAAGGIGGEPGTSRLILDSTECYNTSQGTWSSFAPLNYARYFASSAVDPAGNWYVFGGYDSAGKPIAITERYDRDNNVWVALSSGFNVGIANPADPQAFASPPRAWSRGAYTGTTLWIVGGETENQQVLNIVQKATLFRGNELQYIPLVGFQADSGRLHDTFSTAQEITYPGSAQSRFYTPDDIVDMYNFQVPTRQPVRISLIHLGSGNNLDLVIYTDNKRFVASGRQPGTVNEVLVTTLDPGRYFVAVERVFPILGTNPTDAQYLLVAEPG